MLEYHAAYYRFEDDDGWYVVSVLDFPGVHTQGRTLREARFMVRDALQLMVECYLEEGKKLPKPNAKAADPAAKRIEKVRMQIVVHKVTAARRSVSLTFAPPANLATGSNVSAPTRLAGSRGMPG